MAKLVSAAEVIDVAFINQNVDPSKIKDSYIEVSQEEHIRPILTQDLYDIIVLQKAAGTLTAANTTLMTYIKPALCFFVAVDIVSHLAITTSNKGIMINASDTSEAATREERKDIQTRYREQGITMLEKMVRFIEHSDNIASYPLYENGSSSIITTDLKGGIIL